MPRQVGIKSLLPPSGLGEIMPSIDAGAKIGVPKAKCATMELQHIMHRPDGDRGMKDLII
jgi:hypothetical protein